MACSLCNEAVTVAQLVGAITNRIQAARMFLGKTLKLESNADLKDALEAAEKAVAGHREVQLSQVKFSQKVATQIVPAWEGLAQEIEETNKEEVGRFFHAFGSSASVSSVPVKYSKEIQQEVESIQNSGETTLSMQSIIELYEKTKSLLRESLENIDATSSFSERLQTAEEEVNSAAAQVTIAKEKLIEANRNVSFAEANREAYKEVQTSSEDMHERISEQIRQKRMDLQASEKRRRDYTWNMWGIRIGMWENDVKLSEREVIDGKKELALLELRLEQHEANSLKAKAQGGLQATMEADHKASVLRMEECLKAKAQAEKLFNEKSEKLNKIMAEIDGVLQKAGVHTERELNQLRRIHATISRDALVAQSTLRMDTDPFEQLRGEIDRVVRRVKGDKTLLPQAKRLRTFIEMADGENGTRMRGWQQLLKVYNSLDKMKFAEILSGVQPENMLQ